ncbi:MAG: SNF2-related protein [Candidatus Promineifilaceae bacterium]
MSKLSQLELGVRFRLDDNEGWLTIVGVESYAFGTTLITYRDVMGNQQECMLGEFDMPRVEIATTSNTSPETEKSSLLPMMAGWSHKKTLSATEKRHANTKLKKLGYQVHYDKVAKISHWLKGELVYQMMHLPGRRGDLILLDDAMAKKFITRLRLKSPKTSTPSPTPTTKTPSKKALAQLFALLDSAEADDTPSDPDASAEEHAGFKIGMYVRVPTFEEDASETHRKSGDLRDFRIGRITNLNPIANSCEVTCQVHRTYQKPEYIAIEYDLGLIKRGWILPNTPFQREGTTRWGRILVTVSDSHIQDTFANYFVEIGGKVIILSEDELLVASHRQDVNPYYQLLDYEFHHPSFQAERDVLIESYAELTSATFGLQDLVGSRVMLLSHQADVIATVLADKTCRYILADEVGLGKTIEACVILKGIERQEPTLKTLIVAPLALVKQWQFELDKKFWMTFDLADESTDPINLVANSRQLIISTELVRRDHTLAREIAKKDWGLLIADEAHHLHKDAELYKRVYALSKQTKRVLILSATPIQKEKTEFLALLKLVNPERYDDLDELQFAQILEAQEPLRNVILDLRDYLNEDGFDLEEFNDEIVDATESLSHDKTLVDLITVVSTKATTVQQIHAAKEVFSYISENYRIENRLIRNRRANLQIDLPERKVNTDFAYRPAHWEGELLSELYDYVDNIIKRAKPHLHQLTLEYGRILLYAAFSSPQAIDTLLAKREGVQTTQRSDVKSLLFPAAPRREMVRVETIIAAMPRYHGENQQISQMRRQCRNWINAVNASFEGAHLLQGLADSPFRFGQVLNAIQQIVRKKQAAKIILFSAWVPTLKALKPHLDRVLRFYQVKSAEFHSHLSAEQLQEAVDSFQTSDDCNILLCDELGGEGRNFQIADAIIHIDLPWTPAQIEQRIGRVDRLGRTHTIPVLSIVPFAKEQVEEDLFRIWHEGFELFTRSMSGMEIALETILQELVASLGNGTRDSLVTLLSTMKDNASSLRESVEEERYFEEIAIDEGRRKHFDRVSERYQDGTILGMAFKRWADQIGLRNSYKPDQGTLVYYPKQFHNIKMRNAQFVTPPNMEKALGRSGRKNTKILSGTFDRERAVQNERLIFYAPGETWTGAILQNAIEADRGRCCTIRRSSKAITETVRVFDLLYTFQVDPRALYQHGAHQIHLHHAQEFLQIPSHRLLISSDGELIPRSHPAHKAISTPYWGRWDKHLGKRSDGSLKAFKESYPSDIWRDILAQVFETAEKTLAAEFTFDDDADEAQEKFGRKLMGQRSAVRWRHETKGSDPTTDLKRLDPVETINEALVAGIRRPLWRLESACFWIIDPA